MPQQQAHTGIFVGALFMKEGKILTAFRANTERNKGKYGLIGGKLEHGESPRQGVAREIAEEVGLRVSTQALHLVHTMSCNAGTAREVIGYYFLVTSWEGEPVNKEPNLHSNLAWIDYKKPPAPLIEANLQALECIDRSIPYSEYGWD